MRKLFTTAMLAMLALSSCKKDEGSGCVCFDLGSFGDLVEVTRGTVADYSSLPQASDFNLTILNSSSSELWSGKLSDYPETMTYKVGNYSVSASYGTEGEEGFAKPCFAGRQSFSVTAGQTSEVSVPVTLSNCIIKFYCTDAFKKYFPDYAFSVTTGSGTELAFPKNETRAAFIEAYKFTVSASMTSQAGVQKTFSKEYSSLSPATCYTVKFDVENSGGVKLTVSFNESLETVDLGDVELND